MTSAEIIILAASAYIGARIGSFAWELIGEGPEIAWIAIFALAGWGGAFAALVGI